MIRKNDFTIPGIINLDNLFNLRHLTSDGYFGVSVREGGDCEIIY
jgi:hypothetical protein